jgi:hypothetical protein
MTSIINHNAPSPTGRLARWRDALMRSAGAGAFSGVTLGAWFSVLRENHFAVDLPYWPRVAAITLGAIPNTFVSACERLIYGRRVAAIDVPPPVIILGAWRSGTTHLHNLFAVDDRFAYPNLYQVACPKTFLLTERGTAPLMNWLVPAHRPQDNVKLSVTEPQEDEFALCSMTGHSSLLTMAFPRNAPFHERFLSLGELSPRELEQWKAALVHFAKKLTYKYRRPLVLKSPGHTCRIDVLRELFPGAKFVHIHRNPYDVFRSAKHTLETAGPWWQFQRAREEADGDESVLRQTRALYDGFFLQRDSIPAGHFHEIAFEALERDPVAQMAKAYEALALPDFAAVKPRVRRYVESLSGYRKNAFPPLPEPLRARIATEWRRCFEEWGYAP